jgi:hypothetical protein
MSRLVVVCLLTLAVTTHAAPPHSPLAKIPGEVDFVLQIPQPRKAVEAVTNLDLLESIAKLPFVKEQLASTAVRRARQLLAYAEKTMGAKYPELLDQIAGGGMALAGKYGDNAPLLLVLCGTDEKAVSKFFTEFLNVLDDEISRQAPKAKLDRGDYLGVPGARVGDAYFARMGSVIFIANKKEAMKRALDLNTGKAKKSLADNPLVAQNEKLLPKEALVKAWFDLEPAHESTAGKALYMSPRDDFLQTVLFGGYLDLLGKSPFFGMALTQEKTGFSATLRFPKGRDDMGADGDLHVGSITEAGCQPLLQPKNALYSLSFYLDLARLWSESEKHLPPKAAKDLKNTDKSTALPLGGVKLSALMATTGPRHRVVVANQSKTVYTKKPKTPIPAFAFVTELREEEKFGRSMDTILRAIALLATQALDLKLHEETHKELDIVSYRFDEEAKPKDDASDFRFNFSPSYVRVGKQYVFCSTIELARELVDLLLEEQKNPKPGYKAKAVDRYFAAGFAELMKQNEDSLLTQTILDEALPVGDAKNQVGQLIALVRSLGGIETRSVFEAKKARIDVHIRLKK